MAKQEVIIPDPTDFYRLHEDLVHVAGGRTGTTNPGQIESILHSSAYLDEQTPLNLAVYFLTHTTKGHPFVDGNKRTAYFGARYLLMRNGADFNGKSAEEATQEMELVASAATIDEALGIASKNGSKDFITTGIVIPDYNTFHRLVVKSIGVAKLLSER